MDSAEEGASREPFAQTGWKTCLSDAIYWLTSQRNALASYWPRVGEAVKEMEVKEPATGMLPVVPRPADNNGEGTFVLLPVVGEPDATVAVFNDGSYARWIPFSP